MVNNLRLTKQQKNKIIDIAIPMQTKYFGMCTCLMYAIKEYCNIDKEDPNKNEIARDILHKKFPRFNRENFLKFVEKNYPENVGDVVLCRNTKDPFWIAINENVNHIRCDYLKSLKQ